MKTILFFALSFFVSAGYAGKQKSVLAGAGLKYRTAKQVNMDLKKTVISSLIGKESKYEGRVQIGGALFRLENTAPNHSLIVFDGKSLWNVQYPEGGLPAQVARAKIDKKNQSQILVATLLSRSPIQDQLKVEKEEEQGSKVKYFTQPKKSDWGVQDLHLTIDRKTMVVSEISYKDDLSNETRLEFSNVKFLKSLDKKIFSFSPAKGTQVIEL